MTDYRTLIQGDLFDIMESDGGDPFYDTMQILHDEEHETNSPERLAFFQDLLKNEARTLELDRNTLAPWLLAYIWNKTELPNYTREAWRTLIQLDIEDELLIEAAIDICSTIPTVLCGQTCCSGKTAGDLTGMMKRSLSCLAN